MIKLTDDDEFEKDLCIEANCTENVHCPQAVMLM
jgi:hypothetical protein